MVHLNLGPREKGPMDRFCTIAPLWFVPCVQWRNQWPTSYYWSFPKDANRQSLIRDKTAVTFMEKWDDSQSHWIVTMIWRFMFQGHGCGGYKKGEWKVFLPKHSFMDCASLLPLPYKFWPSLSQTTFHFCHFLCSSFLSIHLPTKSTLSPFTHSFTFYWLPSSILVL